jgi:MFS family permease
MNEAEQRMSRWRRRLGDAGRAFGVTIASRNLRRAQLSFAAAWTGEWMLTVAISVVAFRDGGSTAVGAVAFLRLIPAAFLSPVGTALADRFPRDRVLRWACTIRAGALAGCAAIVAAEGPLSLAYGLTAVATVAFVVFRPVHSALLPSLCRTPLELTSANVVRGLVDSVSTLIGPALAAVLLAGAGPAAALGCAAILTVFAGLALTRLSYDSPPSTQPAARRHLFGEAIDGFRALRSYPDVFLLVRLTLTQAVTRGCFSVLVVVVAIEVLDVGEAGVGVLTAAVGAGAVLGSLAVSMFADGRRLAVLLGAGVALWGLPLIVVGALPREGLIIVMLAVVGVGNALVDVGIFTLPPRLVPDAVLSRIFGALESLGSLVVAGACLLTPVLLDLVGVRWTLAVVGALGPVYVVVAWMRLRAIDRKVTRRDKEIELLDQLPMFRPLSLPAIEQLADRLEPHTFEVGAHVVTQGNEGDCLYVIEHGTVHVVRNDSVTGELGAGDCFGEIALLRDVPRTSSVVATTALRVHSLARDGFLAALAGPAASRAAAEALVSHRLDAVARADARTAPLDSTDS